MATAKKSDPKPGNPQADAVLLRMLNTPPTPHVAKPVKKARAKKKA